MQLGCKPKELGTLTKELRGLRVDLQELCDAGLSAAAPQAHTRYPSERVTTNSTVTRAGRQGPGVADVKRLRGGGL
jgi:hypothetical protein